jgi:membrane associated rhomboid family serine protease
MMNISPTVKQLLIINIMIFIGAQFIPPVYDLFSLYYIENPHFRFWQPITHMFMHAPLPNIFHIAFNMYALVAFGSILERFWGSYKFLFFYISCGLGAFLIQTAANYYFFHDGLSTLLASGFSKPEIMDILNQGKFDTRWQQFFSQSGLDNFIGSYVGTAVGASGAIYGLLIAFAFMLPNAELMLIFIPFPIKAKYFVPILVAFDLFSGTTGYDLMGGGVAHFAHVGGALTGFIMMWFWKKNQFKDNRWN